MVKSRKTRAFAIAVILVFSGILCFALSQCGYGLEEDFPLDEPGTTNTNMQHAGAVVEKKGWIYYPNQNDGGRLYRRSLDGAVNERMWSRVYAYYINVIGNRIWYISGAAGGAVYELRRKEDGRVYSERKLESRPCRDLMAAGGFLFYIVYPEKGDRWVLGKLYRLDLRSGEKRLLENDVTSYGIYEGNVYFGHRPCGADSEESVGALCKMDLSGDGYTVLTRDDPYNIEIVDNTVYYARQGDHRIYSIKTDGRERRVLPEDWREVYVTAGFIYYQKDERDSVFLRRVNTDGSNDTEIFANRVSLLDITEHMILFKRSDRYYVSDLDGGDIRPWP
jgi:hypothetical protein